MLRKMLRSKIHRATITFSDLHYVGSVTIDADLLREADIRPNEAVQVLDIDNGSRFETYVIRGEAGSGVIGINGAAAHLVEVGHKVIIVAYGQFDESEVDDHLAKVVVVDEHNRISQTLSYPSTIDETQSTLV